MKVGRENPVPTATVSPYFLIFPARFRFRNIKTETGRKWDSEKQERDGNGGTLFPTV